jgi:hypothetical protein
MSDGGKGSSPRPKSVSCEEWSNRWDAIFQRDVRKIEDQKNEDEEFERIKLNSEMDKITRYNEETQEVKNISR